MDVSSVSDCVLLDSSIPTIALDETARESEDEENSLEATGDTAEDGEIEMDEEEDAGATKYKKNKLMRITFSGESFMQKYGPDLIEFMQQKCSSLAVELDNEKGAIVFYEKVEDGETIEDDDEDAGGGGEDEDEEDGEEEEEDEDEEESPMFMIDSTPSKGRSQSSDSIPRYNTSLSETLSNDPRDKSKDSNTGRRGAQCFNCDGDHNLRDCPEPRNHQKINANRKARMPGKTERYHVDLSQRYGHIRPGQISKRLSKALGLKSKDLPIHVFRMRKMGYPPGWLEEAKISHSGINLFGSDGIVVRESDDEDGEVDQDKDKYDPTKIIEFPGFNVDAPEGSYDDANLFGCPPMQDEHRKENFLVNLGVNLTTAYKRRKMMSFPMNDSLTNTNSEDMDIVNDDEGEVTVKDPNLPPLPDSQDNSMAPPPPPPTLPTGEVSQSNDSEAAKNDNNSSVNDSLVDFIMDRDAAVEEEANGEPEKTPEPPKKRQSLSSKTVQEGTPLLKTDCPFDTIPSGDKWAVGVSDVINFENLPDSVGKYEKMKVLIKKVQKTVKEIHGD